MSFLRRAIALGLLLRVSALAVPHDVESRAPVEQSESSIDPKDYPSSDIIRRDVAIIGGGSAGTYAAVRLHDAGKSVAVIDRKTRLGGHAETYTDPRTGTPIDIGVVVFPNYTVVTDYFKRLNVELTSGFGGGNTKTSYANFATGQKVDFQPPATADEAAAFDAWSKQIAKYPSLLNSWNTTYPIAKDLLIPFGDFVKKYKLDAMMYRVFLTNQGFAPLLNLSTIYMVKYLNDYELSEFKTGFLTTKNHDIAQLYDSAAKVLGQSNLFFSSNVLNMDRSGSEVRIAVSTPSGKKLVIARKLVSAGPPLVDNLKGYDLSGDEKALFSQFFANGYYTGLLKDSGLATTNVSYNGVDKSQPYNVPKLPGIYSLSVEPKSGLTHVYAGTAKPLSDDDAKKEIATEINRVRQKQGKSEIQLEWVTFSNHAPFNLQVSNQAIADGFYKKLYALNGQRNTFWTGAAFQTQDSSKIWPYNRDYIVPIVLGSLSK